jgi:hypothetical protein
MRRFGKVVAAVGIVLGLMGGAAQAQTTANIGYFGEQGFVNPLFSGAGAFINTGAGTIDINYSGNIDPIGNGQHGNTIIVTPIVDPVIYFNSLNFVNLSGSALVSVTFRLPIYSTPGQLGFVNPSALGLPATGFGSNGQAFTVSYIDPIGTYSGDYAAFNGLPLYSALHFSQNGGTAEIADLGVGNFSFYGAFPAPTTPGGLSFFMDLSASSSNSSTAPNAPGTPGAQIVVNSTSAPEPATLALAGLGIVAGLLLARRRCG